MKTLANVVAIFSSLLLCILIILDGNEIAAICNMKLGYDNLICHGKEANYMFPVLGLLTMFGFIVYRKQFPEKKGVLVPSIVCCLLFDLASIIGSVWLFGYGALTAAYAVW